MHSHIKNSDTINYIIYNYLRIELKFEEPLGVIIILGIQTKWTEFRPNSDHKWANGLNSDQLRKIRPEWQQCKSNMIKGPLPTHKNVQYKIENVQAKR